MKTKNIIQRLFLLPILFGAALTSCMRDDTDRGHRGGDTEDGLPATVSFSPLIGGMTPDTRAGEPTPDTRAGYHDGDELEPGDGADGSQAVGSALDSRVSHVRVLIYRSETGQLAFNIPFTAGGPDGVQMPITVEMLTGEYDFVFIANAHVAAPFAPNPAPLDAFLSVAANVSLFAKLHDMVSDWKSYGASYDIPMIEVVRGVRVIGDNNLVLPGGQTVDGGVWYQPITRTGARLSLEITLTPYQYDAWNKQVSVANGPTKVWMMPPGRDNTADRQASPLTFTAAAADITHYVPVTETETDREKYTVRFDRIILPELLFDDTDTAAKAWELSVNIDGVKKARVSTGNASMGYTLPRNTWLHLDVTVQDDELLIDPEVIEWNGAVSDVLVEGKYTLEVDRPEMIYLASGGTQDLGIRTNAPDGWKMEYIGPNPYANPSPWIKIDPTHRSGPASTDFAPIEVVTDPWAGTAGVPREGTFLVSAYGGRLRKTIRVVQMIATDTGAPTGVNMYVGAFWRADQTGERLIRVERPTNGAIDGEWSATVAEGSEWIVLDGQMTEDQNVGWRNGANEAAVDGGNDPDFDTEYSVNSLATWIGGTLSATTPEQALFFRIGLRSEYTPTSAAPARYGVVILKYTTAKGAGYHRIWIRQGEEADYIMAPGDPDASGAQVVGGRPSAQKFAAYNLTDPARNDIADYAAMVDASTGLLPVHGGAFTDYPSQIGYSFKFDDTRAFKSWGTIAGWTGASNAWNANADETCPPGYRRPADITTEFMPSLTQNGAGGDVSNTVRGYYADGFFDRRTISTGSVQKVAANSVDMALAGRVFFNPVGNASVFMPAAGHRSDANTITSENQWLYWTSDWNSSGLQPYYISDRNGIVGALTTRGVALYVRCVATETEPQGILAPPGVIGYIEGTDELTLAGSKEYAGTSVDNGKLSDQTVYTAMFKFGSLVATTSNQLQSAFSAADIVRVPADGYKSIEALRAEVTSAGAGAAGWAKIPASPQLAQDAVITSNATSWSNGLGDPCEYYFPGEGWITPTGSFGPGTGYGWNGGTFGSTSVGGELTMTAAGARWYGEGALGTGLPSGIRPLSAPDNSDESMFLPTGYRFTDGSVQKDGSGAYWSRISADSYGSVSRAFHLFFWGDAATPANSRVYPSNNDSYQHGFGIRCVPEPQGVHAAPGVIGYYTEGAKKGQLTLSGSSVYKGTPVETNSEFGPLADVPVYTAFFKRGSLIALDSGTNTPFDASNILAGPSQYDLNNLKNNIIGSKTGSAAWGTDTGKTIPYRYGSDAQSNGWKSEPNLGLGDPCDYYFDGDYKLPSGNPWYNEGGSPFGAIADSQFYPANWQLTSGPGNGARWVEDAVGRYNSFKAAGAVAGDGAGNPDWSMFLPAAGARNENTGALVLGGQGYYWSSSYKVGAGSYSIGISSVSCLADNSNTNAMAYAARCVPAPPQPAVLRIDAPPGMLGVRESNGELTLLGSSRYDGNTSNGGNSAIKGTAGERVWLVHFKPGSLVALYGGLEKDLAEPDFGWMGGDIAGYDHDMFGADNIAWVSPAYGKTLAQLKSEIGSRTGRAAWDMIPEWKTATFPVNNAANNAAGFGDPCAFTDSGAGWKLPSVVGNGGTATWNGKVYNNSNMVEAQVNGIKGRLNAADKLFFPYDGLYAAGASGSIAAHVGTGEVMTVGSNTIQTQVGVSIDNLRILFGAEQSSGRGVYVDYAQVQTGTNGSLVLSNNIRCVPATPALVSQPGILYYAPDGSLAVGEWDDDGPVNSGNMAYIEFGSLIGMDNSPVWDPVASIKFNPTATASYAYPTIPNYFFPTESTAWAGSVPASPIVSSPAYHNQTNVAAGRGDICKMVGLTSAEAAALRTQGTLHTYDSGWRTPTAEENVRFVGGPNPAAQTWVAGSATAITYTQGLATTGTAQANFVATSAVNPDYLPEADVGERRNGAWLPVAQSPAPTGTMFLPTTSNRISNSGSYNGAVTSGFYWSSTPRAQNSGYRLLIAAPDTGTQQIQATASGAQGLAHPVRCVKNM